MGGRLFASADVAADGRAQGGGAVSYVHDEVEKDIVHEIFTDAEILPWVVSKVDLPKSSAYFEIFEADRRIKERRIVCLAENGADTRVRSRKEYIYVLWRAFISSFMRHFSRIAFYSESAIPARFSVGVKELPTEGKEFLDDTWDLLEESLRQQLYADFDDSQRGLFLAIVNHPKYTKHIHGWADSLCNNIRKCSARERDEVDTIHITRDVLKALLVYSCTFDRLIPPTVFMHEGAMKSYVHCVCPGEICKAGKVLMEFDYPYWAVRHELTRKADPDKAGELADSLEKALAAHRRTAITGEYTHEALKSQIRRVEQIRVSLMPS